MNKPKILVVEDEVIIAEHLGKSLRQLGYEPLLGATSARQAIDMTEKQNPDLVLMDIVLEGDVDGIEAAERIYSRHGIPIVYLTGHGDSATLSRAKLTEPFGHLLKPIRRGALRTTIEVALYKGRMEQKLRASEAKYRELAELLPQLVYELDEKSDFTFINRNGLELLGYITQDVDEGLSFLHSVKECDHGHALVNQKRILSGERMVETELTAVRKDGSEFPIVAYDNPIVSGGKIVGIRGVAVDLTERRKLERAQQEAHAQLEKRVAERTAELRESNEKLLSEIDERETAEKALRASEERFRTVFEGAQDSIFIKDKDSKYTHVNPAMLEILGLSMDDMMGKTDLEIFGPRWYEDSRNLEDRVLEGQIIEAEHTLTFRGTTIVFLCIRVPMHDSLGKVKGLCGIARDVTQRKEKKTPISDRIHRYTSQAIRDTVHQIRRVAETDSIVLFLGESGTGKDFFANYLHDQSRRSTGPFFTINCAALPSNLAESELFGYEPGSFTGAGRRKKGLLELAEGGTLLLNEIGELSLSLQSKLLTFLDSRSFTRVGGEKLITVNARLVGATNRDLADDVSAGRFRSDLYYRLNVITIRIPPLRERMEDLPVLIEDLATELAKQLGLSGYRSFDQASLKDMEHYDWPGNIRELRNFLERSLILSTERRTPLDPTLLRTSRKEWNVTVEFPDTGSLNDVLRSVKTSLVEEALKRSGGNQKAAAKLLRISYDSFRHHLRSTET
jgi:PAS domain S-box-containing protein